MSVPAPSPPSAAAAAAPAPVGVIRPVGSLKDSMVQAVKSCQTIYCLHSSPSSAASARVRPSLLSLSAEARATEQLVEGLFQLTESDPIHQHNAAVSDAISKLNEALTKAAEAAVKAADRQRSPLAWELDPQGLDSALNASGNDLQSLNSTIVQYLESANISEVVKKDERPLADEIKATPSLDKSAAPSRVDLVLSVQERVSALQHAMQELATLRSKVRLATIVQSQEQWDLRAIPDPDAQPQPSLHIPRIAPSLAQDLNARDKIQKQINKATEELENKTAAVQNNTSTQQNLSDVDDVFGTSQSQPGSVFTTVETPVETPEQKKLRAYIAGLNGDLANMDSKVKLAQDALNQLKAQYDKHQKDWKSTVRSEFDGLQEPLQHLLSSDGRKFADLTAEEQLNEIEFAESQLQLRELNRSAELYEAQTGLSRHAVTDVQSALLEVTKSLEDVKTNIGQSLAEQLRTSILVETQSALIAEQEANTQLLKETNQALKDSFELVISEQSSSRRMEAVSIAPPSAQDLMSFVGF